MQHKVQTYIENHKLLEPGLPVIVGVSGGSDSVALLHILVSLGYNCVVAHCNFHLRMDESLRDELFVRDLAKIYGLPFYTVDFETIIYANEQGISIEMAARDLRYNWFYELLKKTKAQAIAVAHHADDSIETMLMNLVRGTGLRGLTGIPARNRKVVRPLLSVTRKEIESYLLQHNLQHVEDCTNSTTKYLRNKFRHTILPLLQEINPSVRNTLYESLSHFEGSLAIYEQAIEKIRLEVVHKDSGCTKFDIQKLKQQADVQTVLYELLRSYGFSTVVAQQVFEQLDGESGKLFYSETHKLLKDREYLILYEKNEVSEEIFIIPETDSEITNPVVLKITRINVTQNFEISKSKNCVHIDASRLVFPLQLRHWREGDSFCPFGMKQRKKLSDYFIDKKFSRLEKEQCWLLISGNDIVWIVGERTDDRFKVTEQTQNVIEFKLEI